MIYTIGYEGRDFWEFSHILSQAEVNLVLDVRDYPDSRRRDFHKNRLPLLLQDKNIDYIHLANMGNPYAGRKAAANKGDFAIFKQRIAADPQTIAELDIIRGYVADQTVIPALMCYCRQRRRCHAKIITDCLQCEVVNLGEPASIN